MWLAPSPEALKNEKDFHRFGWIVQVEAWDKPLWHTLTIWRNHSIAIVTRGLYDSLSLWVNATAVPNLSDLLPTYPILQRSSGAGHVEVTGVKEIDGLASLWPNQGASGTSGASGLLVLDTIQKNHLWVCAVWGNVALFEGDACGVLVRRQTSFVRPLLSGRKLLCFLDFKAFICQRFCKVTQHVKMSFSRGNGTPLFGHMSRLARASWFGTGWRRLMT